MTKKIALTIAMTLLNDNAQYDNPNYNGTETTARTFSGSYVRDTLASMIRQLDVSEKMAKDARKAKTAEKRATLVAEIIPILREVIVQDMTAKEIYEAAKAKLPNDFSAAKVQNILLREMKPELDISEIKGHANTYRLK